ncbi:MAG TPA: hypothetical protein VGQ52_12740, partial [Gemmatimonadaceae bacterium]|nr:hypothetical protein [Gemmatimonadaceae bacterium]
ARPIATASSSSRTGCMGFPDGGEGSSQDYRVSRGGGTTRPPQRCLTSISSLLSFLFGKPLVFHVWTGVDQYSLTTESAQREAWTGQDLQPHYCHVKFVGD